jgi:hypothetical protein
MFYFFNIFYFMKKKYKILIYIIITIIIFLIYSTFTFTQVITCKECCAGCALCDCSDSCKKLTESKKYKFIINKTGLNTDEDCGLPPNLRLSTSPLKFDSQNINNYSNIENYDSDFTQKIVNDIRDIKFEFYYPPSWEVIYRFGGISGYAIAIQPKKQIDNKKIINDSIFIDYFTLDKNETEKIYKNELKKMQEIFINKDEQEINLNKTKINKIIGEIKGDIVNGNQGSALIYYNNEKLYRINTYFNDENEKYLKEFNGIISSFKIID